MSDHLQDGKNGVRHIKLKPNVRLNIMTLQPKMTAILRAAALAAPELYNHVMMVTSADDGTHSENSKHYTGHAVDLRILGAREGAIWCGQKNEFTGIEIQQAELAKGWVDRIKDRLPDPRYVVLYEGDHIHIQYGRRGQRPEDWS